MSNGQVQWLKPNGSNYNVRWEGFKDKIKPSKSAVAATAVALVAISALIAGGVLLYLHTNAIASYVLLGSGGLFLISDLIALAVVKCKMKRYINCCYNMTTWNAGTLGDLCQMIHLRNILKYLGHPTQAKINPDDWDSGLEVDDLKEHLKKALDKDREQMRAQEKEAGFPVFPNQNNERTRKIQLLKNELKKSKEHDFICLQEIYELTDEEINEILPDGFSFKRARSTSTDEADSLVAWQSSKFNLRAYANITEYPNNTTAPATAVLLRDKKTNKNICVVSSRLTGFDLSKTEEEKQKNAKLGDNQLRYDLKVMNSINADLYIYTGDFNVTREHYSQRLKIIEDENFTTCNNSEPTILDANLKDENDYQISVKLDYVYARHKFPDAGYSTDLASKEEVKLYNFEERASDHLPLRSRITTLC